MANTILVGAQWGDEGKGKVIDVLTGDADWIVRYQGGNNAGHTVEVGDDKYILHLIPSGVLRPDKRCVIGNGVVVDPMALVGELQALLDRGCRLEGRFFLSDRAHIVFPYHRLLDEAREERTQGSDSNLGTTKRGIGPCYGDKAARVGFRAGDLLDPSFAQMFRTQLEEKNAMLSALGAETLLADELLTQCLEATKFLRPFIQDTILLLHEAMSRGESILCEGAQGTMLDIDYGTYPFVTSSHATAGGACTGTGIPPNRIDKVLGVIKAYTTRVGEGPFPTELFDQNGKRMAEVGHEFGATTGRPRRCGWFDVVVARYAAMVNGIDSWALTKMDVLDEFPLIRICTGYQVDGKTVSHFPGNIRKLEECRPVYEDFPGWKTSTKNATSCDALPEGARAYIRRLEELTDVPVELVSVGPRRSSTIRIRDAKGLATA